MGSVRSRYLIMLLLVVVTLALGRQTVVRALGTEPPGNPTPQELLQFLTTVVDDLVTVGDLPSCRGQGELVEEMSAKDGTVKLRESQPAGNQFQTVQFGGCHTQECVRCVQECDVVWNDCYDDCSSSSNKYRCRSECSDRYHRCVRGCAD